jgi:hypothetical protein
MSSSLYKFIRKPFPGPRLLCRTMAEAMVLLLRAWRVAGGGLFAAPAGASADRPLRRALDESRDLSLCLFGPFGEADSRSSASTPSPVPLLPVHPMVSGAHEVGQCTLPVYGERGGTQAQAARDTVAGRSKGHALSSPATSSK